MAGRMSSLPNGVGIDADSNPRVPADPQVRAASARQSDSRGLRLDEWSTVYAVALECAQSWEVEMLRTLFGASIGILTLSLTVYAQGPIGTWTGEEARAGDGRPVNVTLIVEPNETGTFNGTPLEPTLDVEGDMLSFSRQIFIRGVCSTVKYEGTAASGSMTLNRSIDGSDVALEPVMLIRR